MSQDQEFQTISIETTTNESSNERVEKISPSGKVEDVITTTSQLPPTEEKKEGKPVKLKKDGTPDRRATQKHLFKKGQSGNLKGRPRGTKNRLTILREAVLNNAETLVLKDFEEIVKATLELAKAGDSTCLKIIWDRVIPNKRPLEEKKEGDDKFNISISIEGMEVKAVSTKEDITDAEFEEVVVEDDKTTDK